MITVNGKIYDGVAVKPDLDEALEHYGVKGMKWRKHLKSALSKASRIVKYRNPIARKRAKKNVKESEDRGFKKTLNEEQNRYDLGMQQRLRKYKKSQEIMEREKNRGKNHNLGNGNANSGYRKKYKLK